MFIMVLFIMVLFIIDKLFGKVPFPVYWFL